ncbi:unnamed protein product [Musa acuminata subsp. malaccensis]|uniref:(wild Malaysian banana) hypothetical protein n=1 Tax=Musa acuminata subsp. malaccensis TaxID=214687 RepID=A0A804IA37_MUSAM|nr:PREDICTED: uncharacterized protein LOC103977751 [Musa acuminata subsp. malaccensis]CAG1849623.1 unnamed protein product [Musa acuminata subsp. malaccensis]
MEADEPRRSHHSPRRVDPIEEHLIDQGFLPSKDEGGKDDIHGLTKHESRVLAKKCGDRNRFACGRRFGIGDVVWAKAFAYTWWPGRIEKMRGSSAWVSFYGCVKSRLVRVVEIHGFEESYARMLRIGGVKLSDAVRLALEDLQRRTALGLMCSCRSSAMGVSEDLDDQIAEATRFEPMEMLGFVLDVATSAWVGEGETVKAVRMSVQISVYRQHVSICQNSEIDERFCPGKLLDFVTTMAICWSIDDCDSSSDSKAVAQLDGYRKFVSVCPSRRNLQIVELEDNFLSDESEDDCHEMSDSSSDGEIVVEAREVTEDNHLFDRQEDFEVVQYQVQGDEICMVNRADFSLFDLDEEYESLQDHELEQVAYHGDSTWENIYMSEKLEMQNSTTGISLEEGTETTSTKAFAFTSDVNQIADNGTCFKSDEQTIDSFSSCQSNNLCKNTVDLSAHKIASPGEVIDYDGISFDDSGTENLKQQDGNVTIFEHKDMHSAVGTESSDESSLLQIAPLVGRQWVINHRNDQETQIPTEAVNVNHKIQFSSEVDPIVNPGGNLEIISRLGSLKRTAWQSACKKRRLDHPSSSKSSFMLLKGLEPDGEAIASAVNMTGCCTAPHPGEGGISEKSVSRKALMLSGSDKDMSPSAKNSIVSCGTNQIKGDMRGYCSTFLLKLTNQTKFHRKKRHDLPITSDMSNWTRFYVSPLARDISKSSSNLRKPSTTDRGSGYHKSLHMKFPKDFNLPTREELENKFGVFGPLECSRTRVFFYTGAAQVVFVDHADAAAAYRYVKKKSIFGEANVRFWFDEHENFRKEQKSDDLPVPLVGHSSLYLTSCHQVPDTLHISDKKKNCGANSEHVSDDISVHMEERSSLSFKTYHQTPDAVHRSDKKKSCSTNNGTTSVPNFNNSSLNLKSCLRKPDSPQGKDKRCKVRFIIET